MKKFFKKLGFYTMTKFSGYKKEQFRKMYAILSIDMGDDFSNREEKVLGKENWRDSTIQNILQNEIYKGDFVHGKRTKSPTYYENVVEPIISKEMWEDCQVQKKKNSRSYQRTLTYLYLQKIKCPKCNRILGGKATTKKNGKSYFYYYCNDCIFCRL